MFVHAVSAGFASSGSRSSSASRSSAAMLRTVGHECVVCRGTNHGLPNVAVIEVLFAHGDEIEIRLTLRATRRMAADRTSAFGRDGGGVECEQGQLTFGDM